MAITSLISGIRQTIFSAGSGKFTKGGTETSEKLFSDNDSEATHRSKAGYKVAAAVQDPDAAIPGDHVRNSAGDAKAKVAFDRLSNLMGELKDWPQGTDYPWDEISTNDVQTALSEAKTLWERRKQSKPKKYLTVLSSRTIYLSNTMDLVVQNHPEYVELVWGSLRILLQSVVNHEEELQQVLKRLVKLFDSLPRMKLSAVLYPTARMRAAIGELYATLVEFISQSLGHVKSNHHQIMSAVTRPHIPDFKDIIDRAAETSKRIEQGASMLAQAEMRGVRAQI